MQTENKKIGWAIVHSRSGEIWEHKIFTTEKEARKEYKYFNKKEREIWQLQSSESFYYQAGLKQD